VLALVLAALGCGGAGGSRRGTGGTGGGMAPTGGGAGGGSPADGADAVGSGGGGGGSPTDSADAVGSGTGGASTGGAGVADVGVGGGAKGGMVGAGGASTGGVGGGFATGGSAGDAAIGGAGVGGTMKGGAGAGGASSGGKGGDLATGGVAGSSVVGGTRSGGSGAGGAATGGAGGGRVGGAGAGGSAAGGATGTGGALLSLDGSSMDFGSLTLGTTSTRTFILSNRGGATSGPPSSNAEFLTAPTGTLTATGCSAALPPGASCTLTVNATPTQLGLFRAFVRITATPGAPSSSSLSIYVVGWGIGFEVSSPSPIDLGNVAPGVSIKRAITVTALIALSDLKVTTGGEDLSIEASTSTCSPVLAKGASCVVNVVFLASTIGWKRDNLGIRAGGDMGQFVGVEMTANVSKANDLAIEPKAPPTYACIMEQTSPPVVFTVTNVGSTTSGTITAAIVGESSRDFRIAGSDCTTLAPNATCTISVVCSPPMSASAATRNAVLSVTDGNTHLAVPLSGEVTF
jgi:hypothetical protein